MEQIAGPFALSKTAKTGPSIAFFHNEINVVESTSSMNWLDTLLNEGECAVRLRSDLPYFAEHCLKLRPKTGSLAPFLFNPAQLALHRRIEEQKAAFGLSS